MAILVILGVPAAAPRGRPVAIRSGSQLGPKQESPIERRGLSRLRSRVRRGGEFRVLELFTHRRIAIPDFRISSSLGPRWPSRRDALIRSRYRARARKLTAEQETMIRTLVPSRSLRALAAEFDVSHETIRTVVQTVVQKDHAAAG